VSLKALVWQDAAVKTWISYNQPEWIAQRQGVANAEDTVTKMADLLNAISRTAVDPYAVILSNMTLCEISGSKLGR
jgi:uncharacterized protein (DUF302 family)